VGSHPFGWEPTARLLPASREAWRSEMRERDAFVCIPAKAYEGVAWKAHHSPACWR